MGDVADAAGVSITTVSHVLNKTRLVAEDTERAVLLAVAECGYVPDSAMRVQRGTGPRTIGVAISSITNPYFGEVASAIEQTAAANGYSILLADTHDDANGQIRAVTDLLSRRVEAIILAPSTDPGAVLRQAEREGVPVALVDRLSPYDVDQVGTLNVEPTAQLVDHLAWHGHRRIGLVCGRRGLSTTEERVTGYQQGLARNDLSTDAAYIVTGDGLEDAARTAALRLLDLPQPPTAVVVANNQMTIGVMRALRDRALNVPSDIALVAFDDFSWADLFHPRLTVIAQPTQLIGHQVMNAALSRLADPSLAVRKMVLEPEFIRRESCGCTEP
jgi:LacI family transcriptional regulator